MNAEVLWLGAGLIGQSMFSLRFIVQWWTSERQRRSVVPVAFWYFSLAGGALLLAYAIYRTDPVFMIGQGVGLGVYARNLHLIFRARRQAAAAHRHEPA
jgi:lipid-A-disaccharide synthase-like uncharacterized protein